MADRDYPEWMDDESVPTKAEVVLPSAITEVLSEIPAGKAPAPRTPAAEIPVAKAPVAKAPVAERPAAEIPAAEIPAPKPRPARIPAPRARSSRNGEWEARAKGLLKAELKRRNVSYKGLVEKLAAIGVNETEPNIRNKLARGKFTAVFLLQCLSAIGATKVSLDLD